MRKVLNYGLVACLMAAFVFAGCKKDDEDENQNILPKKVSKIVETIERHFEEMSETSTYIYYFDENGRLTKEDYLRNGELKESSTYQYTENSIKYDDVTCSIENGRLTQFVFDEDKTTLKFNYSADGYLASYLYIYEYKGETYTSEMKYTYENGNVVELENKGEDYIVKYTYGQTLNNLNVDLFYIYEDLMPFTGYFGKRVNNLPSSIVGISIENGKEVYDQTTTFTYIYDGEYLIKIEESQGDDDKWTYEIFY